MSMRAGRELGRLLGRMHSAMETFRPSRCERKTWRVKQMCGWWRGPDPLEDRLTRDELRLVRVWEKRIAASWRRKRDVSSWGLVLADVGPHNVIWHEGVASLIDFNDTGWGLSAYDLAVLWHSAIDRRQTACDAVIGGYASVRAIPGGWGPPMQAAALIRVLRHRITRGRDHRKALGLLLDISEEKTSMSSS
jgi:Ser/Thr protein kinase RdoA (MazF antagonist)